MERNLSKSKTTPLRPTRFWRYRMGRPDSIHIATAAISIAGEKKRKAGTATERSKIRFNNRAVGVHERSGDGTVSAWLRSVRRLREYACVWIRGGAKAILIRRRAQISSKCGMMY